MRMKKLDQNSYVVDKCWYGKSCLPHFDLNMFVSQAINENNNLKKSPVLLFRRDVYHTFQRKIPLFGCLDYDLTDKGRLAIKLQLPKQLDCEIRVGKSESEISLFNDAACATLNVFKSSGEWIKEDYQVEFGRIIAVIKEAEERLAAFRKCTRPFLVVPSIKEEIQQSYINGLIKSIELTGDSYEKIRRLLS